MMFPFNITTVFFLLEHRCFMNHRMQMLQGVVLMAKNFLGDASVLSLQKR